VKHAKNRAKIIQRFAQLLDERLFKADISLKNGAYNQSIINGIMKELGIIPNADNSNLMKAVLQRVKTSREIFTATGATSIADVKMGDVKDLCSAILKAFRTNPKETIATIKPIIQWAYRNNDQAMITFFQVLIKDTQPQAA